MLNEEILSEILLLFLYIASDNNDDIVSEKVTFTRLFVTNLGLSNYLTIILHIQNQSKLWTHILCHYAAFKSASYDTHMHRCNLMDLIMIKYKWMQISLFLLKIYLCLQKIEIGQDWSIGFASKPNYFCWSKMDKNFFS